MTETKSLYTERPHSWSDSTGNVYRYYDKPLFKVGLFVLVCEMCERFAFYAIQPELVQYFNLWLGLGDAQAMALNQAITAVMYVVPLVSGAIADGLLGVYKTIIAFSLLYVAGLAMIALSAFLPEQSAGATWLIYIAFFGLFAVGAGGIKGCVNVMGGHQFHPELHKEDIVKFFTLFYVAINVGALVGGFVVPLVQVKISWGIGFLIPLGMFLIALLVFVMGSSRYVKMAPQGAAAVKVLLVLKEAVRRGGFEKCKKSQGGPIDDNFIEDAYSVGRLQPIFVLLVPFLICYNQMCNTFYVQAKKMDRVVGGFEIPAGWSTNFDPIAVIIGAVLIEKLVYDPLRRRGRFPGVLVRFFIGCLMGTAALLCAYGVEGKIMAAEVSTVAIWWQIPQYSLIAFGEIFLISTSYEVAFTNSPDSLKAMASSILLCYFAIASLLSSVISAAAAGWLVTFKASDPTTITTAHYDYYFLCLAAVTFATGFVCLALVKYYRRVEALNAAQLDKNREKPEETVADVVVEKATTPEF